MKLRTFLLTLLCFCLLSVSALAYTSYETVDPEFLKPYFPNHTLLSSVDEGDKLFLLMQNPAGQTVFVGGSKSPSGEWIFAESTPLPEGSYLGCENFYTSLGVPVYGRTHVVTLAPYADGSWGVSLLEWGELSFGRNYIKTGWNPLSDYIGDHPWNDITKIDWYSLPTTLEEAASRINFNRWGLVKYDGVLLNKIPSPTSATMGKYHQGTPVCVREFRDEYARVVYGDVEGWMLTSQIAMNVEISSVPVAETASFSNDVTLVYSLPDENSAVRMLTGYVSDVFVLGTKSNTWAHIWIADLDLYGYIKMDDYSYSDG